MPFLDHQTCAKFFNSSLLLYRLRDISSFEPSVFELITMDTAFARSLSTPSLMFGALFLTLIFLPGVSAHALVVDPMVRGGLSGTRFQNSKKPIDRRAPRDHYIHFPAGKKCNTPGCGFRSQKRAVKRWTEFKPLRKGFGWRAGVCGDPKNGRQEHRRGGRYYYKGKIVKRYRRGSVVNFKVSVVAHHNGFFEFHVCDVSKCGGDISPKCFAKKGACVQLKRAKNRKCDGGRSPHCGPKDRRKPGRWYVPCERPGRFYVYGQHNTMTYQLPRWLRCKKCVLHWYHSTANACNPPGVISYFKGPDRPRGWGRCKGQAGAIGGFTQVQKPCAGRRFSEEYYQCADISIL